jgi:CBS domain containing-hemolysin-like protein
LYNLLIYLLLLLSIVISFWVSLVEATYLTVRSTSLMEALNAGNQKASKALKIIGNKTRLVSTTTFVDTISNVVLASTTGLIISSVLGPIGWVYSAVLGSLGIMVFLYLFPKAVGVEHATSMAITLAPTSWVLLKVLSPITVPLAALASRLSSRFVGKPVPRETQLVNEFEAFLMLLERSGHVTPGSRRFLKSALSSSKVKVGDVATPTKKLVTISQDATVGDAVATMGRSMHANLPVYDAIKHVFLGAITFKSIAPALAAGRYSDSIVQYIVEPPRVKHDDYVSTAMEDMEKSGITMALVTKDGDVTGMITLTDILEEILDIKV